MKAEILAPAGNWEMLEAAVRSGADAVYLGATEFSARRNAQNFSREELKRAIEYCKIRNVRVYLAINILIKDKEMESAFTLAKYAYNCGVDGVIVEDLGLAELLQREIPELNLHASTQMSVHSASALEPLSKLGFVQVVASREMSKSDLEKLCKKSKELGITVEVFVHGALCMCLSGQCLLSAFLGSRSGNRGLCAGPCRLPFKAEKGTGYDLSLKDLSLLDYINELSQMGVGSFKIEGRMKRPEYVSAAVIACRQMLDNAFVSDEIKEILKNVFSRSGFTDGYYTNRLGKEMFGIRTKDDVLSADSSFPKLHEFYRNERQTVPLNITFIGKKQKNILLKLQKGTTAVTVKGDIPQDAKNKFATREDIESSLSKLGGTPYFTENISVELDEGIFISQSVINGLRRNGIEALNKEIINNFKNEFSGNFEKIKKNTKNTKSDKLIARFEDYTQIPEEINEMGISAIIYPLEKELEGLEYITVPKLADIPQGCQDEDEIHSRLIKFKEKGFIGAICNNLSQIPICEKAGLLCLAGTGLNIYNSYSLKTIENLGLKTAIISNEASQEEIAGMQSNIPKGYIIYGNIPLMVFKNCPIKNGNSCKNCDKKSRLIDRMGVEFPVRCRMGYSELLNSCPVWLGDKWNKNSNLDYGVLYFTQEDSARTKQIIQMFIKGEGPDCKHTKGLFYRGVI